MHTNGGKVALDMFPVGELILALLLGLARQARLLGMQHHGGMLGPAACHRDEDLRIDEFAILLCRAPGVP